MLGLRHQLAVHSPIPLAALVHAARPSDADTTLLALERELAEEYSADRVVLCGSGTQALLLAIAHACAEAGEEMPVALPAFCCYDVASAAVGAGATVALYDVEPETLSPDLASLERLLRSGVRVLVVAHLYGVPVCWSEVERLATHYGVILIEDAAQGHGALWEGRPLGSLGTMSVLSFGRGKGWTGGSGGALLLRGGGGQAVCSSRGVSPAGALRNVAGILAQWALGRPALYGLPLRVPGLALGETRYHPPLPPRPISPSAARLLLHSRAAALREARSRQATAVALLDAIDTTPALGPIRVGAGARPGYLRLPLRLPRGLHSLGDLARVRRLGIAPSYPTPLVELPALEGRFRFPAPLSGARTLARELITLPTHSRLTLRDLDAIRHTVRGAPAS